MKSNTVLPTLLAVFLCLAGCTEQEPQAPADGDDGETLFQPQIDALDKARDVENMLRESSEEQNRLLDNP